MDKTPSNSFQFYLRRLFTSLFNSMKHEDRGVRNVKMTMNGKYGKRAIVVFFSVQLCTPLGNNMVFIYLLLVSPRSTGFTGAALTSPVINLSLVGQKKCGIFL
jgi:hypothetical protein